MINNFGLVHYDTLIGTEQRSGEPLRAVFAGNIGRFQGLEQLVVAASIVSRELPLELTFMGAGSEVSKLQHLVRDAGLTNVKFVPYQASEVAARAIAEADLGIISLAAGVCQVGYPSKTMAYVTAGCPVLAIVETDSQLSKVVRYEFGYVSAGMSPPAIADALRMASRDTQKVDEWSAARFGELGRAAFW